MVNYKEGFCIIWKILQTGPLSMQKASVLNGYMNEYVR